MLIARQLEATSLDEASQQTLLAMLPATEQQRRQAMVSPSRRNSFLLGRALLRHTLARQWQCREQSIDVAIDAGGRPCLPGSDWQFSLSHSGVWVMLLLARSVAALGLDVECPGTERQWSALARRRFPARLAQVIQRCSPPAQAARFHRYWTLLEACAKAEGCSVLDSSIHPLVESLAVAGPGQAVDFDGQRWHWWFDQCPAYCRSAVLAGCGDSPQWRPVLVLPGGSLTE